MFEDIVKIFAKKNINVIPVASKEEACDIILKMITPKSKVGYGGSLTLENIGILDKIREGDYIFYDRTKVQKYTKNSNELGHLAQHADYFLSGSNAITRTGEIVNVDRTGNRVSSLIYGPEHVIIVVGKNKIVNDVGEGLERIKTIAAPLNAERIHAKTPCAITGRCGDCMSEERLCCNTTIIHRQFRKDRMNIVLINEDLGY